MIQGIGTTNPIQRLNAMNAFKFADNIQKGQNQSTEDISDGIDTVENNILNNKNLQEIKDCAQKVGEMNVTDDDIKYGLTYGRSVIADYIA